MSEQQVSIGFTNALSAVDPNWSTVWSEERIGQARTIYALALRDTTIFIQNGIKNIDEGLTWLNASLQPKQEVVDEAIVAEPTKTKAVKKAGVKAVTKAEVAKKRR